MPPTNNEPTLDTGEGADATDSTSVRCYIGEYVRTGRVCVGIIRALAQVLDTEPHELEPLYHAVDCDALDELFRSRRDGNTRSDFAVTFDYDRVTVTVSDDGHLAIEE